MITFGQIKKNVIKLHPENYAFGSLPLGYERAINGKNTLDFGIGIPLNKQLSESFAENMYPTGSYAIEKATISNMHFRVAFRHYTGKQQAPKGFYYEPYLKYQTFKPSIAGVNNHDIKSSFDGTFSSFNGGLQLGYQFLIAKTVTLDFYFFGLEAGMLKANLTGETSSDLQTYKDDIEKNITDLPYVGDKIAVKVEDNKVKVTSSNIFYPSIRMGFSLGIAF
jgi:hypothetical protein